MIPAYTIGLYLNRHVVDLDTFLRGGAPASGLSRRVGVALEDTMKAKRILLVDDSITSGKAMRVAAECVRDSASKVKRYAGPSFATQPSTLLCTSSSLRCSSRGSSNGMRCIIRIWNILFDLDGIFCVDPTREENDDGPRYLDFLKSAKTLHLPSRRVGHIVSARLEKNRAQTKEW